jgi:hypothetical protein
MFRGRARPARLAVLKVEHERDVALGLLLLGGASRL